MTALDRIEVELDKLHLANCDETIADAALRLRRDLHPLLPLLREWAAAEEAAAREIDRRHPEPALLAVLDMKAALRRGALLAALRTDRPASQGEGT